MVSTKKRVLICLIPPLAAILVFLLRDVFVYIAGFLYTCDFYRITGLYCPGCGNTRSVLALLHLDIFTALGYNITPVFAAVLAGIAYAELLTWGLGHHRRLFPRTVWFWVPCGCLFAVYFLARNFFPFLTLLPS